MKTLINILIMNTFIFLVFIFSGCEQITDPADNSASNNASDNILTKEYQARPFVGELIYTYLSQINDSVSVYTGTGNATHFGYCTVVDTTMHHYTLTGLTVEGTDWITTANGSVIHMTWFMDYYDPTTWVWEFHSGTRQFYGVSGSGPFTAAFTSSGDLWVRYTGTITY